MADAPRSSPRSLGRYQLFDAIGAGGMASVHLGRLRGGAGFTLTVAIKRLLPEHAAVPRFADMLADEARLAGRVRHPNVVPIFDVVASGGEIFLVMEHVIGVTLAELLRRAREQGEAMPPRLAAAVVCGALEGLHAAHEARDERGAPLGIVHRDVSPQNVLVGADGVARVSDFGVARARERVQMSSGGALKGKIAYMAPEQLTSGAASRTSDVYAAAVVLWEALTGQRPFPGSAEVEVVGRVLVGEIDPPSRRVPGLPPAVDAIVRRATSLVPEARFPTARAMSVALAEALPGAQGELSAWVQRIAAREIAARAELVARVEAAPRDEEREAPRAPPAEIDVWRELARPAGGRDRTRGP